MIARFVLVLPLLLPTVAFAAGFQVLTVGKVARFTGTTAVIVVGHDRALASLHDPRCPTTSNVALEAYLQSTVRDATLASVALDCAKWSARGRGYVYSDPAGTVRTIRYRPSGLRIEATGFTPIGGPVGFVQAQLGIGTDLLRARFHNFRRNDASEVLSRK